MCRCTCLEWNWILVGPQPQRAAIAALTQAEAALEAVVAGGDSAPATTAPLQLDAVHAAAVLSRLRFRRCLLELFLAIPVTTQRAAEDVCTRCDAALAYLAEMEGSVALSSGAEAPGFVPNINRRHMAMVAPRPIQQLTVIEAIAHWRQIVEGIADVHSSLPLQGGWPALSGMLVQFAAKGAPPIVRSVMHLTLVKPLRPLVGATPIQQQLQLPKAPNEVPPWSPSQAMIAAEFQLSTGALPGEDAALFIEQCAIAVQAACHTLCLNRSRQRRGQRRLLRDWVNMADHAMNAEASDGFQAHMAAAGWRWGPHRRRWSPPLCEFQHFQVFVLQLCRHNTKCSTKH